MVHEAGGQRRNEPPTSHASGVLSPNHTHRLKPCLIPLIVTKSESSMTFGFPKPVGRRMAGSDTDPCLQSRYSQQTIPHLSGCDGENPYAQGLQKANSDKMKLDLTDYKRLCDAFIARKEVIRPHLLTGFTACSTSTDRQSTFGSILMRLDPDFGVTGAPHGDWQRARVLRPGNVFCRGIYDHDYTNTTIQLLLTVVT